MLFPYKWKYRDYTISILKKVENTSRLSHSVRYKQILNELQEYQKTFNLKKPSKEQIQICRQLKTLLNETALNPETTNYTFKVIKIVGFKSQRLPTNIHSPKLINIEFIKPKLDQLKQFLRQERSKLNPNYRSVNPVWKIEYLEPNVHSKPNTFGLELLRRKLKIIESEKQPKDNDRYVGIELEFCAPYEFKDIAKSLVEKGLGEMCQLKTDGSLRPKENESAFELAILVKEKQLKSKLKQITEILKAHKAETEKRRCGLHVHLDMRNRNKEVAYSNLVASQTLLGQLVNPSRINNEFCRTIKSRKFPKTFTGERKERYKSINAAAFYRHKTIEVRLHEGSVDFNDIYNWTCLLIKIVNLKKEMKRPIKTLNSLKKRVSLNKKVLSALTDKACYWQINRFSQETTTADLSYSLRATYDSITVPSFTINTNRG